MAEKRHGEWVEAVLGLGPEWTIAGIERSPERKELRVRVAMPAGAELQCARCGKACPGYDTRRREWRHLNAWTYRTFVVCDVPRVRCPEHGVVTMQVPWAEGSSRYTAEFEADVVAWLQDASVSAVARRTKLSWNAVAWIMDAAVRRGLAPGAARGGQPDPGRHEVPVADGPQAQVARREAGVREAPGERAEDGPRLGAEGDGGEAVELPDPHLGDGRMEPVAGRSMGMRSEAGGKGRRHDRQPSLGHPERRRPARHERTRRGNQQPDQDGQGAQPRLPQPAALRQRHPLPSRRPRPPAGRRRPAHHLSSPPPPRLSSSDRVADEGRRFAGRLSKPRSRPQSPSHRGGSDSGPRRATLRSPRSPYNPVLTALDSSPSPAFALPPHPAPS